MNKRALPFVAPLTLEAATRRRRNRSRKATAIAGLAGVSLLMVSSALPSLAEPSPFTMAAAPTTAVEQETIANGPIIKDIEVKGVQRLESETVLSYLHLSKGEAASPDKIDESLKALYATGLFSDIRLAMDDSTLIVTIVENPIVNRVTFEGEDSISKEDLEKEVQLKPRLVYTLPRVQKDVQRILDLYRRSGRFGAVVEPKLVQLDQNRVDVIFEITEGKHTGVRRIKFIGNEHFDEDDLRGVINTRESAWWRFFTTSDFYDPDRTNYDRELLRRYYLNEGYIDFRVASAVAELTPDRDAFFLTFTVEEGPRYKFGKVNIQSDIKGLDGETLRQYLTTKQGDWYNAGAAEKSIAKLTEALGDMQYAFVDITPEVDRHKDSLTVDLTYHIKQGQRVYIGRIDVQGNTRTLDKVIRREMQIAEGDPFSTSKINRSEQRIKDLGYFEDVKVTPAEGAQPDRSNLQVEVKEKSTGEIALGAGFSSTDGPLGDLSIRERNFLGRGQDVRLGATVSGVSRQFDLSFTEPYFLDRNLSAGIDIFHTMRDNQNQSSYNVTNTGFAVRLGYPLSDDLRQLFSYTLRRDEIDDVPVTASRFIRDQQGSSVMSMIGHELTYDVRDSKLEPTKGFVTRLNTDFAGLGGDHKFFRARLSGSQYYELVEHYILGLTAEGGYVFGIGQDVKITDRFFLGGDTFRGFQFGGLGPRDLTNGVNDALGGNRFSRGTIELTTPTPLPDDLGFKGHIFTDAGTLGHNDENPLPGDTFKNEENLRASVGVGVTWQSPFGPVRLDLAKAVLKEDYDKTEIVHFSFGTKF
jgi:outer membrane protein insertion porin family